MNVMHNYEVNITKSFLVVGDTHTLAFKNKILNYPDYKLNIKTDVLSINGLKTDNIVINGSLRPEFFNFLKEHTIVDNKGFPVAMTEDIDSYRKHYLVRQPFDTQVILFYCGDNDIKDTLKILKNDSQIKEKLNQIFTNIVNNYLEVIDNFRQLLGQTLKIFIHDICPPTADDNDFLNANGFLVDKEVRAYAYNLFNKILHDKSEEYEVNMISAYNSLIDSSNGLLKINCEFDGFHANDTYVNESLGRITKLWMMYRIAERSGRYYNWYRDVYWKPGDTDETNPYKSCIPLSQVGISNIFKIFNRNEVETIIKSIDQYKDQLLYGTMRRDYSTLPPEHKWNTTTEVKIGKISKTGIQLIYDKFFNTDLYEKIKNLLGANFSLVNVRPTYSEVNNKEGTGPQRLHVDMCPPALFRALVYLVDVGEGDGAFEYVPIGGNKETTKVYGSAGDLFLFDADVLEHRATPPINKPRIALDLIILAQPTNLSNVVTSVPGTGWPVDPYQFELSYHAITSNHDRRWFSEYPKIIAKNSNVSTRL